jgi:hypothetical protein
MAERALRELKPEALARQKAKPEAQKSTQAEPSPLNQLHHNLGNQAVQRLVKQGKLQLSGGAVVQAKLTVTPANDQYEREADAVADQVARKPYGIQRAGEEDEMQMSRLQRVEEEEPMQGKRIQRAGEEDEMQMSRLQRVEEEEPMQGKRIQRAGEEDEMQMSRLQRVEEEEPMQGKRIQRAGEEDEMQMSRLQRVEEEEPMQGKREDPAAGFDVGGSLEQAIQSQRGKGQAMPEQAQRFFGDSMGSDFSGVRVHTDSQADDFNKSISARAFTLGSDVFFRSGEYNPENPEGRKLLAHELTHVVQQGAAGVQKKRDES